MTPREDIRIDREEARGAAPLLRVTLPADLDARAAQVGGERLAKMLDGLRGGPFSLLLDARALRRGEAGALAAMKEAERAAVRRPGLQRVAHLVAGADLAAGARAALAAAGGGDDSVGAFSEEGEARAFIAKKARGGPGS